MIELPSYYCPSQGIANSLTNKPMDLKAGFILLNFKPYTKTSSILGNIGYMTQVLVSQQNIFVRYNGAGNSETQRWSDWKVLSTVS